MRLFASDDRHTPSWSMILESLLSGFEPTGEDRFSEGSQIRCSRGGKDERDQSSTLQKRKPRASGAEGDNYEERYSDAATRPN
jgi:hypothetical protein